MPPLRIHPDDPARHLQTEWLLTDGLGGFAMGTGAGVNTRRYHGLLIAATQPPVGRVLALHSIIEQLVIGEGPPKRDQPRLGTPERVIDLATQQFGQDLLLHPGGLRNLVAFTRDDEKAQVRWTYHIDDIRVEKSLRLLRGRNAAVVGYRVAGCPAAGVLRLRVLTPLRDFHALQNQSWQGFHADASAGSALTVRRDGMALRLVGSSGSWRVDWQWWTNFAYEEERRRGQDWSEDVFSPAVLETPIEAGVEQSLSLHVDLIEPLRVPPAQQSPQSKVAAAPIEAAPVDRRDQLLTAADQFVVQRRVGDSWSASVIAGYPWFGDWGRDTMISLPGLLLVPGRIDEARQTLITFARHMKGGLIPNLFDDYGGAANYNTVDGSLWFIHAVHALWQQQNQVGVPPPSREGARGWVKSSGQANRPGHTEGSETFGASHPHGIVLPPLREGDRGWVKRSGEAEHSDSEGALHPHPSPPPQVEDPPRRGGGGTTGTTDELIDACRAIVDAYHGGTDFGIRMDADSLITAGDAGTQLTWMDAKRDGIAFTPRYGKAVEINALWIHALRCLAAMTGDKSERDRLLAMSERAGESFRRKFWWKSRQCLHDVLVPHEGDWRPDGKLRPNQIFAVSLGDSPLSAEQQRAVVQIVEQRLLTPFGLRTLDRDDPAYRGRYEGSLFDRDAAYHQGTVWPWLIGAYGEAVLRVGGFSDDARSKVRAAIQPLLGELDSGCLGQIAEVYDGEAPHRPSGCPAQAWSVAELLRVVSMLNQPAPGLPAPGTPAPGLDAPGAPAATGQSRQQPSRKQRKHVSR